MDDLEISNKPKFSNIDLEDINPSKSSFNIKVIGVGGAGCNVINHIANHLPSISQAATLYAFNTDLGSLRLMQNVDNLFLLDKEELKGYGSGCNPEVGKQAVEHDAEIIKQELKGTDILFIIAGMGKGAGSGGAPELAKIAKELGILTVAIVNIPSVACEGNVIYNNAFNSLQTLISFADSVTTMSSEQIVSNNRNISFYQAYELANEGMGKIIEDIIHIIFKPSKMNVDFADLKAFFTTNKFFMMNRLIIDGNNIDQQSLKETLQKDIKNNFSDINIENAKHVICNINMSINTQTTFLADLKKSLAEITRNDNISVVSGIDYNNDDRIYVSYLISGTNFANDFTSDLEASAEEVKFHDATKKINSNDNISLDFDQLMKDIDLASTPTKNITKGDK